MKKDNIIKFPTPEEISKKEALELINLASIAAYSADVIDYKK